MLSYAVKAHSKPQNTVVHCKQAGVHANHTYTYSKYTQLQVDVCTIKLLAVVYIYCMCGLHILQLVAKVHKSSVSSKYCKLICSVDTESVYRGGVHHITLLTYYCHACKQTEANRCCCFFLCEPRQYCIVTLLVNMAPAHSQSLYKTI